MPFDPTDHDHGAAEETADDTQSPPPGAGADSGRPAAEEAVATETAARVEDDETAEAPTPEQLAELTARADKAEEYLALAQRKQAEFENFRKRSARDAAAAAERGATKLARELLPAVDNLERALEHAPEEADAPSGAQAIDSFVAGVRHVHSDLVGALQRAGIEQYSPKGEPFDPTLHEAVAQQPIEGATPGTVVEVFQRGYRVGETVVRPARVVVAG